LPALPLLGDQRDRLSPDAAFRHDDRSSPTDTTHVNASRINRTPLCAEATGCQARFFAHHILWQGDLHDCVEYVFARRLRRAQVIAKRMRRAAKTTILLGQSDVA